MSDLQLGDTGRDVEVWQRFLANIWVAEFDTMLFGVFDEATLEATRAFQLEYNLDVTGVVDRKTREKANLRGLSFLDGSTYNWPSKSRVLAWFALLVLVSAVAQCMLMPTTSMNINGVPLPLNPSQVPGTPPTRDCPGWFC